jgi:hypothetical protein
MKITTLAYTKHQRQHKKATPIAQQNKKSCKNKKLTSSNINTKLKYQQEHKEHNHQAQNEHNKSTRRPK